jgi:hypothetical protein
MSRAEPSRAEHSWRLDQRRPIGEAVADFRNVVVEAPPVDRIALGLALSGKLCLFAHRCLPFPASSAPLSCARPVVGRQRFGLVLTFTALGPDATTRRMRQNIPENMEFYNLFDSLFLVTQLTGHPIRSLVTPRSLKRSTFSAIAPAQ